MPEVHGGSPLVFDSLGKISIVTIMFTLNEFTIPRKCVVDYEDHLNQVVGLLWLNTDKPVYYQQGYAFNWKTAHGHSIRSILQLIRKEVNGTFQHNNTKY